MTQEETTIKVQEHMHRYGITGMAYSPTERDDKGGAHLCGRSGARIERIGRTVGVPLPIGCPGPTRLFESQRGTSDPREPKARLTCIACTLSSLVRSCTAWMIHQRRPAESKVTE